MSVNLGSGRYPKLSLFCRGWLQVALVSANVVQVSQGRYGAAFVTGWAISAVWWQNSHSAGRNDVPGGWLAYSLGAACGTVSGMWLAEHVFR